MASPAPVIASNDGVIDAAGREIGDNDLEEREQV